MKTILLALVFAAAAVAAPARAQTADGRWAPWIGCWELSADTLREGAPAAARGSAAPQAQQPRNGSVPRVCVTPAGEHGARFETTIGGERAIGHTVLADAAEHAVEDGDCRGTQRAEWSRDGLRLFTRAELACAGEAAPRQVSGFSFLAPNGTWLDIQSVDIGGRESVRVRRYYRAAGEPAVARTVIAASALSLDDVKEASGKVSVRTLEAALVESDAAYNLRARHLLDLDAAGVPASVIDLMVALSYPERFVVERTPRSGGGATPPLLHDPYMLGWAFGYPVFYDDFFYSPYYYTPFGYSGYSRGYYVPYGSVGSVAVAPQEPRPSGTGRVVDGQGYTRIREVTASAVPTATRDNSGTSSAPASSSESGSGTASSTGGYSGGASSGDTGRTAQPR